MFSRLTTNIFLFFLIKKEYYGSEYVMHGWVLYNKEVIVSDNFQKNKELEVQRERELLGGSSVV